VIINHCTRLSDISTRYFSINTSDEIKGKVTSREIQCSGLVLAISFCIETTSISQKARKQTVWPSYELFTLMSSVQSCDESLFQTAGAEMDDDMAGCWCCAQSAYGKQHGWTGVWPSE